MVRRIVGRAGLLSASVVALVTSALGCSSSSGGGAAATTTPVAPLQTVTVPADRQTPFCRQMIDLQLAVQSDPQVSRDEIVQRYREILPDAPAEIADTLAAVIDRLEVGDGTAPQTDVTVAASAPSTLPAGSTLPEASVLGYLPEEDPALRLHDYIQFACNDTSNNPGPAPTQPEPGDDTSS